MMAPGKLSEILCNQTMQWSLQKSVMNTWDYHTFLGQIMHWSFPHETSRKETSRKETLYAAAIKLTRNKLIASKLESETCKINLYIQVWESILLY